MKTTIGVDLHKARLNAVVLDERGAVRRSRVKRRTLAYFSAFAPSRENIPYRGRLRMEDRKFSSRDVLAGGKAQFRSSAVTTSTAPEALSGH